MSCVVAPPIHPSMAHEWAKTVNVPFAQSALVDEIVQNETIVFPRGSQRRGLHRRKAANEKASTRLRDQYRVEIGHKKRIVTRNKPRDTKALGSENEMQMPMLSFEISPLV